MDDATPRDLDLLLDIHCSLKDTERLRVLFAPSLTRSGAFSPKACALSSLVSPAQRRLAFSFSMRLKRCCFADQTHSWRASGLLALEV